MEHWDINKIVENFNLNDSFVFFDLGSSIGQELEILLPTGTETHGFEPHPKSAEHTRERFKNYNNLILNESAAWIKNENMTLFYKLDPSKSGFDYGSTLFKSKTNISRKWSVKVQGIDISEYVLNFKKQINIMKIDIEGSEYHVIKHLIDTGAVKKIDNIFFEDHSRRMPSNSTEFYDNKRYVFDKLNGLDTKFGYWQD